MKDSRELSRELPLPGDQGLTGPCDPAGIRVMTPFGPLFRAFAQFDDPVFLGVVVRAVLWSAAVFFGLHVAAIWAVHGLLELEGPLAWAVDILGSIAVTVLAMFLFLPLAAAIGTFYVERVAAAVERRWYPGLPPARGASLTEQVWDALTLGGRILLLNLLALMLMILLPGIGIFLGWAIAAYAIGRGLFMAVAMRRMPHLDALAVYRGVRPSVLAQGAVIALAAYVPLLNLLIPVIGVAAMVHVLDVAMLRPATARVPLR